LRKANSQAVRAFLGLAISFSITFINGILGFTMRILSSKEKYETKTNFYVNVAKRIALVSLQKSVYFNRFLGLVFEQ
jgi:hypothetical protein